MYFQDPYTGRAMHFIKGLETSGDRRGLDLADRLARESQLDEFKAQLTAQLDLVQSEPSKSDMSAASIRESGKAAEKVALGLDELNNRRTDPSLK